MHHPPLGQDLSERVGTRVGAVVDEDLADGHVVGPE